MAILYRLVLVCAALAFGCARAAAPTDPGAGRLDADQLALIDRISWGATQDTVQTFLRMGHRRYLEDQLRPGDPKLPDAVRRRLDAMRIADKPAEQLARDIYEASREVNAAEAGEPRETLRKAFQQRLNGYADEARQRSLLRALYSERQLQEKMTWFWFNHFNVLVNKNSTMRGLIADYEENAIRAHALGKFRDLLAATVRHPAMLIYLDNTQNRAGHINENYGRELLELHTLGADAGYSQQDVQALSRVLTGLGVNYTGKTPKLGKERRELYVRDGVFEFNPQRHDFKDKTLLGKPVKGAGLDEVDQVVDMLAGHPATARHICRKLAVYFVGDHPPDELVRELVRTFEKTEGDIAATLRTLFNSVAFQQSLTEDNFRDPTRYVLGAVRLVHGHGDPIVNARPVIHWLNLLGQPLYGKETPDGYALERAEWQGSGQMAARFTVARGIAGPNPALYQPPGEKTDKGKTGTGAKRSMPDTARKLYEGPLAKGLSESAREVLTQAKNTREWTALLLSTPDFMNH